MFGYYKALKNQVFVKGNVKLIPIRFEDRYKIMEWRNNQLKYLRQKRLLTKVDQDNYFNSVVKDLFEVDFPDQILFSILDNDECIGYGGLVHISWINRNAEISFLLKDENIFEYLNYFDIFLKLIISVAGELWLFKVYTVGYDIDDYRFEPLVKNGFGCEAILKNHVIISNQQYNVRVYSLSFSPEVTLNCLTSKDVDSIISWKSDEYLTELLLSKNEILDRCEALKWINKNTNDDNQRLRGIYVTLSPGQDPKLVGVSRLMFIDRDNLNAEFGFYVGDVDFRGVGIGRKALKSTLEMAFIELGLNKVYLRVDSKNQNAIDLYNSMNFNIEGELKRHHKQSVKSAYKNVILMAIFKNDFVVQ